MDWKNLKLVYDGDPFLDEVCPEFDEDPGDYSEIFDNMLSLMYSLNGVGLAAPQVSLRKRFFVMNCGQPKICINPDIIKTYEHEKPVDEGCLSFPDLFLKIKRFPRIEVEYTDRDNNKIRETLIGLEAQCYQHELDHLNGITFDEKASKFGLRLGRDKQRKAAKKKR